MNSKNKLSTIIYGISLFVFAAVFIWGRFFLSDGDEIGFTLINFYIIMPLVSFVSGFVLGLKDISLKFLYPIIFGALAFIISGLIFRGSWDIFSLLFSLVPAGVGLVAGILIHDKKTL